MNWNVFKKDDSNTYPKINCPMLLCVYYSNQAELDVHYFDNELKSFYCKDGINGACYRDYSECYYAYIGYIPNEYKAHKLLHCLNDNNCKYGCNDDGYCMYDFCECEQQIAVNEYEIEEKRIWKEF